MANSVISLIGAAADTPLRIPAQVAAGYLPVPE
jgi:hypothetical protein